MAASIRPAPAHMPLACCSNLLQRCVSTVRCPVPRPAQAKGCSHAPSCAVLKTARRSGATARRTGPGSANERDAQLLLAALRHRRLFRRLRAGRIGLVGAWSFPYCASSRAARIQRRIRRLIHKSFGAFLWLMQTLGIMRLEIVGADRLRNCPQHAGTRQSSDADRRRGTGFAACQTASCVVKQAPVEQPAARRRRPRPPTTISNSDSDSLMDGLRPGPGGWQSPAALSRGYAQPARESASFPARARLILRCAAALPILPGTHRMQSVHPDQARTVGTRIPRRRFHLCIEVLPPVDASRWIVPGEVQTIAARRLDRALEAYFTEELRKWKH